MRFKLCSIVVSIGFLAGSGAGCGTEIGDACEISSDCSSTGDRLCARGGDLPDGYCTIVGCDFDSCPDNSICVRFFAVGETSKKCDASAEDISEDSCDPEELCTLGGSCVPRTAEVRYCMATCGGDGDCRDGYECRDLERMITNGGEPVPRPGEALDNNPQEFCAAAPQF